MTVSKKIAFLSLLIFVSCKNLNDKNNWKINPKAKKYNDSAVSLIKSFDSLDYEHAIILLNKANEIDSNYFLAYYNKFIFESQLKQNLKALETIKHIIRIKPKTPEFYVNAGMLYIKLNDTISSKKYFLYALTLYKNILDTMSIKNNNRQEILEEYNFTKKYYL